VRYWVRHVMVLILREGYWDALKKAWVTNGCLEYNSFMKVLDNS
jgi:hypothetical protein